MRKMDFDKVVGKNADGYGYKYTDLAEITRVIRAAGWDYYNFIEPFVVGETVIDYMMTVIVDPDGNESEPIRGCRVPDITTPALSGKNNLAQNYGSLLTYCKRYSVCMAFGLATTDDDDAACFTQPAAPQRRQNDFVPLTDMQRQQAPAPDYHDEWEQYASRERAQAPAPQETKGSWRKVDELPDGIYPETEIGRIYPSKYEEVVIELIINGEPVYYTEKNKAGYKRAVNFFHCSGCMEARDIDEKTDLKSYCDTITGKLKGKRITMTKTTNERHYAECTATLL